jgi:hypothetical protein
MTDRERGPDDGLGQGQEILKAHITTEADATRSHVTAEHGSTRGLIDTTKADLTMTVQSGNADLSGKLAAIQEQQAADHASLAAGIVSVQEQNVAHHTSTMAAFATLGGSLDATNLRLDLIVAELARQGGVQDAISAALAKQGLLVEATKADTTEILRLLDESWQDRDDLMPDEGQCVFGVYDGTGEDIARVTELLGRVPGLTTIYWKKLDSPVAACRRLLERGSIPRLELELVTAFGDAGEKMQTERGSLWHRIAIGDYDDQIGYLLDEIGTLERPIVVSWGHESDLRSEQGAYPKKSSGWTADELAGDWPEFADAWRHIHGLAAARGVTNIRWFWNMSGGYADAGKAGGRWDQMFPGVEYVDFVGWDPFDWYGVRDAKRTPFREAVAKFERIAWYERVIGTDRADPGWRPLMIGETACCETKPADTGKVQPADEWLDDMRDWLHAHPYVTHVIYFAVKYAAHDRRLTEGPQKMTGTERAGKDPLLV